jgi:hypothetical protein
MQEIKNEDEIEIEIENEIKGDEEEKHNLDK